MQKNYYMILGVSSTATSDEIKSAFRRRAMEVHPDHSGMESGPFQELQEAYGVLSDPGRRRNYDRQSRAVAVRRAPWGPAPEPPVRPRAESEQWFGQAASKAGFREISLESFDIYHPSLEELFERLWSNFEDLPRPKAEQLENLTLEVVVGPEDAMRGGRVRVRIPGLATCPTCGGHGAVGAYECWRCEGEGALATDYPLEVLYPAGVRHGHAVQVSLSRFGIENLYLTILFRVGGV